jgi:hypothetical protein
MIRDWPLLRLVLVFALVVPCAGADLSKPWRLRVPLPTDQFLASIAYGSGMFVAVGDAGISIMSTDGQKWAKSTIGLTNDLAAIIYGDTGFVAVGEANGGADWSPMIAISSDGVTWNANTIKAFQEVPTGIARMNGVYVIITRTGDIWTSEEGTSWTNSYAPTHPAVALQAITSGAGRFVAVGHGMTLSSADGISWTSHLNVADAVLNAIAFGQNLFVAVGSGGTVLRSADGADWTSSATLTNQPNLTGIAYGGGRFVAVGEDGTNSVILTSSDATVWTRDDVPGTSCGYTVAFGGGLFVVVGCPGQLLNSGDGASWTNVAAQVYNVQGLAYGNRTLVATAIDKVLTSQDGIVWASHDVPIPPRLGRVGFVGSLFFALSSGISYNPDAINGLGVSEDGTNWGQAMLWTNGKSTFNLSMPAYGAGLYVAVGNSYDSVSNVFSAFSFVSRDGRNWTRQSLDTKDSLIQVAYAYNQFIAVGWTGMPGVEIFTSTDGLAWKRTWAGYSDFPWGSLAFGNGTLVTATMSGFLISQDSVSWRIVSPPFDRLIYDVAFSDGMFVASAAAGYVLTSTNGTTWQVFNAGTYAWFWSICSANGTFFTAADMAIYQSAGFGPAGFSLKPPVFLSSGGVQIGLSGGDNVGWLVQASTNLIDWETIASGSGTNMGAGDPHAASFAHRYYRAAPR